MLRSNSLRFYAHALTRSKQVLVLCADMQAQVLPAYSAATYDFFCYLLRHDYYRSPQSVAGRCPPANDLRGSQYSPTQVCILLYIPGMYIRVHDM